MINTPSLFTETKKLILIHIFAYIFCCFDSYPLTHPYPWTAFQNQGYVGASHYVILRHIKKEAFIYKWNNSDLKISLPEILGNILECQYYRIKLNQIKP